MGLSANLSLWMKQMFSKTDGNSSTFFTVVSFWRSSEQLVLTQSLLPLLISQDGCIVRVIKYPHTGFRQLSKGRRRCTLPTSHLNTFTFLKGLLFCLGIIFSSSLIALNAIFQIPPPKIPTNGKRACCKLKVQLEYFLEEEICNNFIVREKA